MAQRIYLPHAGQNIGNLWPELDLSSQAVLLASMRRRR
jgi:hypothetical protein